MKTKITKFLVQIESTDETTFYGTTAFLAEQLRHYCQCCVDAQTEGAPALVDITPEETPPGRLIPDAAFFTDPCTIGLHHWRGGRCVDCGKSQAVDFRHAKLSHR